MQITGVTIGFPMPVPLLPSPSGPASQTPLRGDEEQRFHHMYAGLIQERDIIRGSPA